MAKFKYTATGKDGKSQSGNIIATDKAGAMEILSKQGLKPLIVKEEKTGFDPNNIKIPGFKKKKVKTRDMVIFTRQLATMINAGVPLVRSLATLQQQTDNDYFKEVLEEVSHEVEGGSAFADALGKHPKVFSPVYINMVAAGESGGILDDILKRLAFQQEKESSIKKKVKSASTYPMILMIITTMAFFGLMIFVIPRIGKILKDLGGEDAELPGITQAMLNISDFLIANTILVFGIMFITIYLLRRYIRTDKGRWRWHSLLLKTPILKTIIAKVAIARFSRTFASLMTSGVGVIEALDVTGRAIGNVVIEKELQDAAVQVKNGKQLSEPLSQSSLFPPIVAQMLAIGEETGQIDTILVKVADFYEEEVDAVIESLSSIIEPIMIVIMGAMVGLIAYSVMGPIASLSQNIK
jgi:type IV pilus assembly protein PilC